MVRKVGGPGGGEYNVGGESTQPPMTELSRRAEGIAKQITPGAQSRTDAGFKHSVEQNPSYARNLLKDLS